MPSGVQNSHPQAASLNAASVSRETFFALCGVLAICVFHVEHSSVVEWPFHVEQVTRSDCFTWNRLPAE